MKVCHPWKHHGENAMNNDDEHDCLTVEFKYSSYSQNGLYIIPFHLFSLIAIIGCNSYSVFFFYLVNSHRKDCITRLIKRFPENGICIVVVV